jgi:hypothetical protein
VDLTRHDVKVGSLNLNEMEILAGSLAKMS